jgi:hypothetical protein
MYRRRLLGTLCVVLLVMFFLMLGGKAVFAAEPTPWKIDVSCQNGGLVVEFLSWLPDVQLTAYVDDEQVGEYQTDSQGEGTYTFPVGAQNLTLRRANGDTVLAGYADCTQPRPGIITEMTPEWISLPVGGQTTLTPRAMDEAGNPINPQYLWIAELGSITPEGQFTATVPGNLGVTAVLAGDGFPFSFYLQTKVSPPLTQFAIEPAKIQVLPGQQYPLTVIAQDEAGQPHKVQLEWDTQGSGDILPGDIFMAAEIPGDYEILVTIPGTEYSASTQVHIFPRVEKIKIKPDVAELVVGDIQEFVVQGIGADGNSFSVPLNPSWTAELGVIDADGRYAATEPGLETITAIVDLNALLSNSQRSQGLAAQVLISTQELFSVTLAAPTIMPEPTSTPDSENVTALQATAEAAANDDIEEEISAEIDEEEGDPPKNGFYNYYDNNCLSVLVTVFVFGLAVIKTGKHAIFWLATILMGLVLTLGVALLKHWVF